MLTDRQTAPNDHFSRQNVDFVPKNGVKYPGGVAACQLDIQIDGLVRMVFAYKPLKTQEM